MSSLSTPQYVNKPVLNQHSPLYSIPHFSFTITGFPVSSFKNGFGFTGVAILCLAPLCDSYAIRLSPSKITRSQPCSNCLNFKRGASENEDERSKRSPHLPALVSGCPGCTADGSNARSFGFARWRIAINVVSPKPLGRKTRSKYWNSQF